MMGNLSGGAPEGVPLLFLTDEYFSKFPLFLEKTLSLEYEGIVSGHGTTCCKQMNINDWEAQNASHFLNREYSF